MNIDELLQNLPSREELASAIGLNSRSSGGSYSSNSSDLLPALGLFGTGMLLGAGLALLFAPKSGTQVRQDLSEKMHEFGSQARTLAEEAGKQGRQMASEIQESGRQMAGQTGDSSRDQQMGARTPSEIRGRS